MTVSSLFIVSISADEVFSWESQARQYPEKGAPGIGYFKGVIDAERHVDCLLFRDPDGSLVGILNHYNQDMPPWEKRGNVNMWVREDRRRRGIATALWDEAALRWSVKLGQQRFTEEGAAFAVAYTLRSGH